MSFPYSNSEMGEAYEDWVERTVAEPNTSEEVEEVEVEEPPRTLFQRMFGRRNGKRTLRKLVKKGLAKTRNANNGRVPELTFGAEKQFNMSGFVSPNTGNTQQTRINTFQQNFIKRMYTTYQNAKLGIQPLNLDEYASKLETETNEAAAIVIYDELIVLFILVCVDSVDSFFFENKELLKKLLDKIRTAPSRKDLNSRDEMISYLTALLAVGLTASAITLLLTPVGLGMLVGGGIGWAWYVLLPLLITFFTTGTSIQLGIAAYHCIPTKKRNIMNNNGFGRVKRYSNEVAKLSYDDMFQTLNTILFSKKNPINITTVKNKLKYWGLLDVQVDYMFEFGQNPDLDSRGKMRSESIIKYVKKMLGYYGNPDNAKLAPNAPLTKDMLNAAYPKPPLAGNPFANASAFPERNPFQNVSKLEVPAHNGPLRSMTGGISTRRAKRRLSKQKHRRR